MKIENRKELIDIIVAEDFDKIIFFKGGYWSLVSSSYSGEQDGQNPVMFINRTDCFGLSRDEVSFMLDILLPPN